MKNEKEIFNVLVKKASESGIQLKEYKKIFQFSRYSDFKDFMKVFIRSSEIKDIYDLFFYFVGPCAFNKKSFNSLLKFLNSKRLMEFSQIYFSSDELGTKFFEKLDSIIKNTKPLSRDAILFGNYKNSNFEFKREDVGILLLGISSILQNSNLDLKDFVKDLESRFPGIFNYSVTALESLAGSLGVLQYKTNKNKEYISIVSKDLVESIDLITKNSKDVFTCFSLIEDLDNNIKKKIQKFLFNIWESKSDYKRSQLIQNLLPIIILTK